MIRIFVLPGKFAEGVAVVDAEKIIAAAVIAKAVAGGNVLSLGKLHAGGGCSVAKVVVAAGPVREERQLVSYRLIITENKSLLVGPFCKRPGQRVAANGERRSLEA